MTGKKTRIKDIAVLAGVSIGTIDRVLHNRGEVSEKTKQKVLLILKKTNYSPNLIARVLKSKKSYNLVSLLPAPSEDNPFWQKHPFGIARAIKELDPFPVTSLQVNFDIQHEDDFLAKTEEVLKLKPDGVLLAPIFKDESVAFCTRLKEAKIPFVLIDSLIENTDFLAYVGEDIFQSGKVAGQLVDMLTPEKGNILIVTIAKNVQNVHHLDNRTQGFLSYFEKSAVRNGKILNIRIPDPSKKSVSKSMDKILTENQDIRTIFITGSRSYLIGSYLEENRPESINIVGYDLLESNVKYLKSGIARFLIGQRPEEQAYKGVKKLFEYLSLNKVPDRVEYLPVDIVTSENVDFFL
jgi:LacI family transcriptional regulator